jgi:nitrite reductase/ring-hydroxylating ferredoxin subunit
MANGKCPHKGQVQSAKTGKWWFNCPTTGKNVRINNGRCTAGDCSMKR